MHYLQAWSSLHAHPGADFKGAFGSMQRVYGDALSAIPYLTGGLTGQEIMQSDRDAAVARYKQYKANVLKPPSGGAPTKAPRVRPVAARKHGAGRKE